MGNGRARMAARQELDKRVIAQMLPDELGELAGHPLQPPHFYPVPWQENDHFSLEDDPDRALQPWTAPSFCGRDPAEQRACTTVQELEIPDCCSEIGNASCSFARVIHNVLTPEECKELIEIVNQKGFTPALLNIGGGNQILAADIRDGHRVVVDSSELTRYLLSVVQPHLPTRIEAVRGREGELVELNERCRFLCYTPGQTFEPHCDGMYIRHRGHVNEGSFSAVTLQLYLHDVPTEHGGATTFLDALGGDFAAPCHPKCGS